MVRSPEELSRIVHAWASETMQFSSPAGPLPGPHAIQSVCRGAMVHLLTHLTECVVPCETAHVMKGNIEMYTRDSRNGSDWAVLKPRPAASGAARLRSTPRWLRRWSS